MSDAGKNIKEIRTRIGMSKQRLSKLSGVSHPTISSYERGSTEPLYDNYERIMHALGYRIVLVQEEEE